MTKPPPNPNYRAVLANDQLTLCVRCYTLVVKSGQDAHDDWHAQSESRLVEHWHAAANGKFREGHA